MKRIRTVIDIALLLVALPLAGIVFSGIPLSPYLEFPPLTQYVRHAAFSWTAFIALGGLILATVLPFIIRVGRSQPATPQRVCTARVAGLQRGHARRPRSAPLPGRTQDRRTPGRHFSLWAPTRWDSG